MQRSGCESLKSPSSTIGKGREVADDFRGAPLGARWTVLHVGQAVCALSKAMTSTWDGEEAVGCRTNESAWEYGQDAERYLKSLWLLWMGLKWWSGRAEEIEVEVVSWWSE